MDKTTNSRHDEHDRETENFGQSKNIEKHTHHPITESSAGHLRSIRCSLSATSQTSMGNTTQTLDNCHDQEGTEYSSAFFVLPQLEFASEDRSLWRPFCVDRLEQRDCSAILGCTSLRGKGDQRTNNNTRQDVQEAPRGWCNKGCNIIRSRLTGKRICAQ